MGLFKSKQEKGSRSSPVDRYLSHLNDICQKEPLFFKHESLTLGLPGVSSIVYTDIPEPGFITGFTYGLSLVNHPSWKKGRPELCISVKSTNIEWGRVAGHLANGLRGDCPFLYGQTINFREKIHNESDMSAFFVFAPSILDKELYLGIDIGTGYQINIAGLYPMYEEELGIYAEIGLEKFWHHSNFDLYNVNRPRVT